MRAVNSMAIHNTQLGDFMTVKSQLMEIEVTTATARLVTPREQRS